MSRESAEQSRTTRAAALVAAQRRREQRRRWLVIAAVVAVVLVVLAVALVLGSRSDTSGDRAARTPDGVDDYTVGVGDADAPSTVTVYEDPQCPVCAQFEAAVAEPLAEAVEAGEVRVDYRIVSFLDRASTNDYSSRAANALMAVQYVAGPEAFAQLHRVLYENQPAEGGPGPDDGQLVDWAVEAGTEASQVRPLIEDRTFEQYLVNATDQMSKDGVNGTPTVFVDGEKVDGTPADSVAAVREALGTSGS